jgi:hypothetical protein
LLHDRHLAGLEIQITPPQSAQFALPRAAVEREGVESRLSRPSGLCGDEEGPRLGRGPGVLLSVLRDLVLRSPRFVVQIGCDVRRNQSVLRGLA